MKAISYFQAVFAALGGWLEWFLESFDGFIYALIAFIVVDYITGLIAAVEVSKLSREFGFCGIFKKVLIFLLVGGGTVGDRQIVGDGSVIRTAIIFFYISYEGISIIENSGCLVLPVPQKLKEVLDQFKAKGGYGE